MGPFGTIRRMAKQPGEKSPSRDDPGEPGMSTAAEVAALLKWHPESVRAALRKGRIRGVRIGNRWRVAPEVVVAIRNGGFR